MAFSIQKFRTDRDDLASMAFGIRQLVFVDEQHVSPDEEYDEYETESLHYLIEVDGQPAGTARWRFTPKGIKLERFAILPAFRNKGAGTAILQAVLEDVLKESGQIYLHAQVAAMNLYLRAGFRAEGDLFYEAGIPHYRMIFLTSDTGGQREKG